MGQTIPNEVRAFSKYKCIITEKKNADDCYLTAPADSKIGKKLWQGNNGTLHAGNDVIINFSDDTKFESKGIGADPGIFLNGFPKELPKNICLRIKYSSPNVDLLQIYFYTVTPENTLLGGHVYLSGLAGTHDVAIVMPSKTLNFTYFRLDPGAFNSHIDFDNISIHEYHTDEGQQNAGD